MRYPLKKLTERKNIKGFILLELVIVLVIIVILLAILIPLITHYIDDARENAELSETRAVKVALQTIINEDFIDKNLDELVVTVGHDNYGLSNDGKKKVENLLEMKIGNVDKIHIDDNQILNGFSYFTINGSKIRYENDKYITEYIY